MAWHGMPRRAERHHEYRRCLSCQAIITQIEISNDDDADNTTQEHIAASQPIVPPKQCEATLGSTMTKYAAVAY
jgi:hypothetical protein